MLKLLWNLLIPEKLKFKSQRPKQTFTVDIPYCYLQQVVVKSNGSHTHFKLHLVEQNANCIGHWSFTQSNRPRIMCNMDHFHVKLRCS